MPKIYKSKENQVFYAELGAWLCKNVDRGEKFSISFKIKKRRKLKSFRLIENYSIEAVGDDKYYSDNDYYFILSRSGVEKTYGEYQYCLIYPNN